MKKIVFILFAVFSVTNILIGQKVYTLEEALSVAMKQSYAIKSAEYNLISSQKNLESAQLGLRTSINLELDVPNYSRTLSNQFNPITSRQEFYQTESTVEEGRLYITQPLVFSNGKISIVGRLFGARPDEPDRKRKRLLFQFQHPASAAAFYI